MNIGKVVDQIWNYIDPVGAGKRKLARARQESPQFKDALNQVESKGYYNGNRRSRRLKEWQPGNDDANTNIARSQKDQRKDSNDLVLNNPIALGAINAHTTGVVGTGLKLLPTINGEYLNITKDEAIEWQRLAGEEWKLFCEDADITRTQTIAEIQELVFRSSLVDGDVFVNLPKVKRPCVTYDTCIELIDGHRICNPHNTATEGTTLGVKKDPDEKVSGYYIRSTSQSGKQTWRLLPAFDDRGERQVLRLLRRKRVNQVRGIPLLSPVIAKLKQLDRYAKAEIDAAVVAAMFAVFVKSDLADGDSLDNLTNLSGELGSRTSDKDLKLSPGMVVQLGADEEITSINPGRPNPEFEPFYRAIVGEIAVGIGLPFETLMKQFHSSYTATRGAFLEAFKAFMVMREWLAYGLLQPLYEAMLIEAITKGRISAPGFLTDQAIRRAYCGAIWTGPGPGELDPWKEAKASEKRIEIGVSNEFIECHRRGLDYDTVHAGHLEASEMRKAAGLI